MSYFENIIGAMFISMVLLIIVLLLAGHMTTDTITKYTNKKQVFQEDRYLNDLNTILSLTDKNTSKRFGILLSDAVYYRSEKLSFGSREVDVISRVKPYFNDIYGKGNYYFIVEPRLFKINLNYILDGSKTLERERDIILNKVENIESDLNSMINATGTSRGVNTNIYVLEGSTNCSKLNLSSYNLTPSICEDIGFDDLYQSSDSRLSLFQSRYNLTQPANLPKINDLTIKQTQEDWGTASAYVSFRSNQTEYSEMTVIMPLTDQLSTSSIDDACFTLSAGPSRPKFVTCSLCNSTCPVNRSNKTVVKAVEVAKDYNHILNPIISFDCDYNDTYQDYWNKFLWITGVGDNKNKSLCNYTQCKGCSGSKNYTKPICFHKNCKDDIEKQMDYMANETEGVMLNLNNSDNISTEIIKMLKSNLDSYKLEVGTKRNDSRDVVQMSMPFPGRQYLDLRLWVYT